MPHDKILQNPSTGRFTGTRGLTEAQATFVREFVANGGNGTKAAEVAGYTGGGQEAWRLRQMPVIREAIKAEIGQQIETIGASRGWRAMAELIEFGPPQVKFQAAKWTLEAASHGLAAKAQAAGLIDTDKPLSSMTITELERFVAESEARLKAAKAVVVVEIGAQTEGRTDAAPESAPEA